MVVSLTTTNHPTTTTTGTGTNTTSMLTTSTTGSTKPNRRRRTTTTTTTTTNKNATTTTTIKLNQFIYISLLILVGGAFLRITLYEQSQQQQQQPSSTSSTGSTGSTGTLSATTTTSKGSSSNNINNNNRLSESLLGFNNNHHQNDKSMPQTPPPQYHTLQCESYGGPSVQDAQEMVYWQDIPSDSHYVSPFHVNKKKKNDNQSQPQSQQYMTFEPDGGGWNNIRMAMETVVGLAIATGRTLVLPPEQRFYLLGQGHGSTHTKTQFTFIDFFPMQELANDNDGLSIISMEEFLETVAMTGQLLDTNTGRITYPPDNRTNWNGGMDVKPLKEYLRNVTYTPLWSPDKCLAVFPATSTQDDATKLQQLLQQIQQQKQQPSRSAAAAAVIKTYPIPVNATTLERMEESLAGHRKELCLYTTEMQQAPVLHFMCYHKMRIRMLVHFYAFLFFEDYREELWMKRFMRDHMRYIDELQCAAARIVTALRNHVRQREQPKSRRRQNSANGDDFDTLHIRRGDFQYTATRIDAQEIYNNIKDVIPDGTTIYIATDERDEKFFAVLQQHYDVLFMKDFASQLEGVNKNHYGMIDQLVASRGRNFFGCWHSTFTGFIARMRGYHSVREKLPGYDDGILPNTYYYTPMNHKTVMHTYTPLHGPFFNREFPTSWRQLDVGIGDW